MLAGYLASFTSRDIDAISAHVGSEFINTHASALGDGSVGRDQYRARLPDFLAMFPGLHYEVEHIIDSDNRAMAAYRMTANHDGHNIDIRGIMSVVVSDGVIVSRTDYWDSLTFLRQIDQAP